MSEGCEAVTIMDFGERNIATPRKPTQINPAINPSNTRLDEDTTHHGDFRERKKQYGHGMMTKWSSQN